ncbi:MAG: SEL1-like repeat protein [Verrucomicrobiota bacterium]
MRVQAALVALVLVESAAVSGFAQNVQMQGGIRGVTRRTVMQPAPFVYFNPSQATPAPQPLPVGPVPVAAAPQRPAAPVVYAPRPSAPVVLPDPVKEAARKAETTAKVIEFQIKRAEEGAPSAQYDLAQRYLKGDGVPKDEAEAFRWLAAAAKNGHTVAQARLKDLQGDVPQVAKTEPGDADKAK